MKETISKELIGNFIDAIVKDPTKAKHLLKDHPALLNSRWIHNESILHFLAIENYVEGVSLLIELGANIELTNKFGDTALFDAVKVGNGPSQPSL